MLRISPFVLPQLRMGAVRISGLNMSEHPERITYAHGLQEQMRYLLKLLAHGEIERKDVEQFQRRAHFAEIFVTIDWDAQGGPQASYWEHAEDFMSFNADHLGLMFLDGRLRDEREMVYVPTGASTPDFVRLIAAMAAGAPRDKLLEVAAENDIELDDDFLSLLVERGVLEEIEAPPPLAARFAAAPGDRVTWMGASTIVYQSHGSTVWIDPLLPPRLRYQPDELEWAFADGANARHVQPYSTEHVQLTFHDLPPPDAVVLSHEDINTFDLGLLMCLPASTTFVVPATRPDRPWQIDVGATITRVLGERRVIRLAHGETATFGDIRVGALPFVGEWPSEALPTDWNVYVVNGREAAVVLGHFASILPTHVDAIAELVGKLGPRAVLFALELYPGGGRMQHGFREVTFVNYPLLRQWPWYLPMSKLFDPVPHHGICTDVLRALHERTGLRRFCSYGYSGGPWNSFELPHIHRHNLDRPPRSFLDHLTALAKQVGVEVPILQIGVPFQL